MTDGYWYEYADGRREWRSAPTCSACDGPLELRQITPIDEAEGGEPISEAVCAYCGKPVATFLKPSQEAIDRGIELAEKYGW